MELRSPSRRRARRRAVGTWVVAGLTAGVLTVSGLSGTSGAAITTPAADSVVRDEGPVTIHEDRGGRHLNTNSALTSGCNDATAARPRPSATVTVTRLADGAVVHTHTHKTGNHNGLFGIGALDNANATAPFTTVWDTTGAEPGLYRLTSVATDTSRSSLLSSTCTTTTSTLSDITVELRPWQHANFNDLLGQGRVRMNSNPSEVQWTIHGATSAITPLSNQQVSYFASPTGLPALPADPSACAGDPQSCIPSGAVACDPAAGCAPRIAVINTTGGAANHLFGIFDLETGAFAASAATGGKSGIMASAGTDLDLVLTDLLDQAVTGTEDVTGLDLLAILSSTVEVRNVTAGGELRTLEVGILHGLELSRSLAGPDAIDGISLLAPFTVNAGFLTHVVTGGFHNPQTDPVEYAVSRSPLVPNLPTLFSVPLGGTGNLALVAPVPVPAPLNAITGDVLLVGGGPLMNINAVYPEGWGSHSVGTSTTGPSVDTAPNAPSGLPAWLPGIDGGTLADEGPMDFLGHAALFLDLGGTCLSDTLCLALPKILVGQGITVFGDSPLPPLSSLPLLWDTDNPAAAELNELTSNLALELLSNPAVGQVLSAALTLLGGGTPDLATVTALLSDLGTFTELIDAVSGAAGLDAVPGLEDTLNELGVVTELLAPLTGGGSPLGSLQGLLGPLGV